MVVIFSNRHRQQLMPPDIQSQTKCSADEVEDCCTGNGVGIEHQRDADPFDLVERQALAVAVGGKADQTEEDCADEIGRGRQGQAEATEGVQFIHGACPAAPASASIEMPLRKLRHPVP